MSEERASIPRYPLEWPLGWRRSRIRKASNFTMTKEGFYDGKSVKRSVAVNMAEATDRLCGHLAEDHTEMGCQAIGHCDCGYRRSEIAAMKGIRDDRE